VIAVVLEDPCSARESSRFCVDPEEVSFDVYDIVMPSELDLTAGLAGVTRELAGAERRATNTYSGLSSANGSRAKPP
jgi:hypothetical protein